MMPREPERLSVEGGHVGLSHLFDLIESMRPAWHRHARCRGRTDDFYLERGVHRDDVAAAVALCQSCPVQAECLAAGLDDQHGIWGGAPVMQRRQIRKARSTTSTSTELAS